MSAAPVASSRLPWVDHLRTFVILLVVNVHACVTYSHVGDWYVMSEHEPTLRQKLPFIVWEGHLQSFFMGLLFFVSGYFAYKSLARRTPGEFARERLVRLGLPTLFFMLIIHPFILLGLNPWHATFGPPFTFYFKYVRSGNFIGRSGPLWFAFALLIFCLVLSAWRALWPARPTENRPPTDESPAPKPVGRALGPPQNASGAPPPGALWLFAFALGLGSFLIRLVQPIGTNVLNFQLCFFVQYIAFFIAGLQAARAGWLLPLARSAPARWAGWLALVGGPILMLAVMFCGAKGASGLEVFLGGWHGQAFAFAIWEQLTGVGLSLGLLALFSSRLNRDTVFLRWLADRSFAVYVLHTPVLVALFMLYRSLPQNLFVLPVLLTLTGLLASFALADLVRRVPSLRVIF